MFALLIVYVQQNTTYHPNFLRNNVCKMVMEEWSRQRECDKGLEPLQTEREYAT